MTENTVKRRVKRELPKESPKESFDMFSYDPRMLALEVLDFIDEARVTTDIALERIVAGKKLSKPDQGLANAIIYGVLRQRGTLDWIISGASTTELSRMETSVLNILRIGIFQIRFLDRIPVSAAVNTSVELSKKLGKKPFLHKFINAVLRKSVALNENLSFPDPLTDPEGYILARYSVPIWLSSRWIRRLGFEETEALAAYMGTIPPLSLRANTLKTDRNTLAESLRSNSESIEIQRYSESGLNITGLKNSIQNLTEFGEGHFQVQDEAAQMISVLLDPRPGEKILDVCCGLGGKTGHIGQLMKNEGLITALDNSSEKLKDLRREMKRLGIDNVKTLFHDFSKPLDAEKAGTFDRILVDAPCSGLGVLRRNPDAKWTAEKRNLSRFSKRQGLILENAAALLKPGGRLVYAVCSFETEENEGVVDSFLSKGSDFFLDADIPQVLNEHPFICRESAGKGMIRILPHIAGMDGFFAACFKRVD